MLEMGITFSFTQLILDHYYIDNIKKIPSMTKLPESVNDPSFVRELIAAYRDDFLSRKDKDAQNRQQKKIGVTPEEARKIAN